MVDGVQPTYISTSSLPANLPVEFNNQRCMRMSEINDAAILKRWHDNEYQRAARIAKYWEDAEVWLLGFAIVLAIFLAGFASGANVVDYINSWAAQVTAQ